MITRKIGFVGGGRITKIFLQAFTNKGVAFDKIVVSEPNEDVLEKLKRQFGGISAADDLSEFADCDVVFLATHPPVVMDAITKLKP